MYRFQDLTNKDSIVLSRALDAVKKAKEAFPSLSESEIIIRKSEIFSGAIFVQPQIRSLFTKRRKYYLVLSSKKIYQDILLSLSDTELIAGMVHELVHIEDYSKMNIWQLSMFTLKYLISKKFHKFIEHRTDKKARDLGFGPAIESSSAKVLNFPNAPESFIKRRKKYYANGNYE